MEVPKAFKCGSCYRIYVKEHFLANHMKRRHDGDVAPDPRGSGQDSKASKKDSPEPKKSTNNNESSPAASGDTPQIIKVVTRRRRSSVFPKRQKLQSVLKNGEVVIRNYEIIDAIQNKRSVQSHVRKVITGQVFSKRHKIAMKRSTIDTSITSKLLQLAKGTYIDVDAGDEEDFALYKEAQLLFKNQAPRSFSTKKDEEFLKNYATYVIIPEIIIKCISEKYNESFEAAEVAFMSDPPDLRKQAGLDDTDECDFEETLGQWEEDEHDEVLDEGETSPSSSSIQFVKEITKSKELEQEEDDPYDEIDID